jgi:hypothetical protein
MALERGSEMKKTLNKIAELNDQFRKSGKSIMLTPGIQATGDTEAIVKKVMAFDDFKEANDPYGEHDFGSFKHNGQKIFWKIDYYNQTFDGWHDPISPECNRVLTIMLAEEY